MFQIARVVELLGKLKYAEVEVDGEIFYNETWIDGPTGKWAYAYYYDYY